MEEVQAVAAAESPDSGVRIIEAAGITYGLPANQTTFSISIVGRKEYCEALISVYPPDTLAEKQGFLGTFEQVMADIYCYVQGEKK